MTGSTAGVAVTAWSVPFNPPPEVVKTGPYRYARNPMLTGVFLFLCGLGIAVNSFSLVCFFAPLYVLVNVWELKEIEEPELVRRLGDEYLDYRSKTPMFIPGLLNRNPIRRGGPLCPRAPPSATSPKSHPEPSRLTIAFLKMDPQKLGPEICENCHDPRGGRD